MYTDLLNIKSPFNFLSSTVKNEAYFDFVKKNNLKAAFQIDTNNMYNAANFYFDALKKEIKPIIGVELVFNKFNAILIPNDNVGYRVLMQIFAQFSVEENKTLAWKTICSTNSENLTIVVVPTAPDFAAECKDLSSFFVGLTKLNKSFIPAEFKNKIVYADPINVLNEEEGTYLKVMTAIKENRGLYTEFKVDQNIYLTEKNLANTVDVSIHKNNMDQIIAAVHNNVIVTTSPKMIGFDNPQKIPSKNYLEKLCNDNLDLKITNQEIEPDKKADYQTRLQYELETITQMGFENYFLVVSDFVNHAKSEKILVGPGRGSAAGSLVSYLLNITEIDPLKFNLLFERFLNPKRTSMPDIDIDFQDTRRQEVLEFLAEKYQSHFALISTFQTMGVKNAIRDCAKIMGIPDAEVDDALKPIEGTIEQFDDGLFEKFEKLKLLREKEPVLFQYANFLVGLPRQSGTHAAGVVLASEELSNLVPISIGLGSLNQIQYSAKYLEKLGLIKIDILGLKNLSTISEILEQIKDSRKIEIDLNKIPQNDHETFHSLALGETNSIFQFESRGMTDTLKQVKPNSIIDLASVMALFRPGPLQFIPDFVKRKNEQKSKSGFGFEVDEILKETYGVIVYQEQVMKILQIFAGFSLDKADVVRAAISKKNDVLLKSFRQEFISGATDMGNEESEAVSIWEHIEKFASYGFNKSHAIAYSVISYWMAYLKNHYRAEFNCAILNSSIKDKQKVNSIVLDIKKHNGKVNGPSIRALTSKYRVVNGVVQMPLTAIAGVNHNFVDGLKNKLRTNMEILKDRKNFNGLILKMYDNFMTKELFDNLVMAGVFDWYQITRKNLLTYDVEILNWAKLTTLSGDFDDLELDIVDQSLKDNEIDIDLYETESLGVSITANVIGKLRELNRDVNTLLLSEIKNESSSVNITGRITNISVYVDKNKENMAFIEFADDTSDIPVTVFASIYSDLQSQLVVNQFYILNIKIQIVSGKIRGILNRIVRKNLTI